MRPSVINPIYLDYNASTPNAPEVVEAMRPFLSEGYGNSSSHHWAGVPAKQALEQARRQVAALLGCAPLEVVFTSGGTEANNHAIKGVFFARRQTGNHIITTQVEHPAVLQPCRFLEKLGAEVTYLPVDGTGRVNPDDVRKAITLRTILVSVMHANNEVGTIQPIAEISRMTRERGIPLHTDAAQSVGKIPTNVADLGVDLLSVAGHKLYAPKGVGALFIRQGVELEPFMHGAGHESGRRAGTDNVLLNVGLGTACEVALSGLAAHQQQLTELRDYFHHALKELFGEKLHLNAMPPNGSPTRSTSPLKASAAARFLRRCPVWQPPRVQPVTLAVANCHRCSRRWAYRSRSVLGLCVSALGAERPAKNSIKC